MNYPFWNVPHIGSGWVIGLIAIFHIMISHFAVGGGLYLPLAERKARREGRQDWLAILQGHSKFFLVLTGVFGAVSGVGIWFSIGLANPEATSTLIHNFVFGWAIEWVFFMVELSTAAVYYYTWGRVSDELHLMIGWVYALTSFLTLVIINGILTFMLTPGDPWLAVAGTGQEASRFWQAFFNPTFWPSLFLRTLACV
jgi:cytochrome bd-type quinol oxidase subunit 1